MARIPSEHTGNAASTAELAVYLLLAVLRRHNDMSNSVAMQQLGHPTGRQLKGLRVLIVGWGNIAKEIAPRLAPFGVELMAVRRSAWRKTGGGGIDVLRRVFRPVGGVLRRLLTLRRNGLEEAEEGAPESLLSCRGVESQLATDFLPRADAVVLTCSQNKDNIGMVGAQFLGAMKEGAVLVNVARGGLFDQGALLAALDSGKLGGLASDVAWSEPVDPKDPVVAHPAAYFTPHIGGVTDVSYINMGRIIAGEARRLAEGQRPSDIVQVVNADEVAATIKDMAPN